MIFLSSLSLSRDAALFTWDSRLSIAILSKPSAGTAFFSWGYHIILPGSKRRTLCAASLWVHQTALHRHSSLCCSLHWNAGSRNQKESRLKTNKQKRHRKVGSGLGTSPDKIIIQLRKASALYTCLILYTKPIHRVKLNKCTSVVRAEVRHTSSRYACRFHKPQQQMHNLIKKTFVRVY